MLPALEGLALDAAAEVSLTAHSRFCHVPVQQITWNSSITAEIKLRQTEGKPACLWSDPCRSEQFPGRGCLQVPLAPVIPVNCASAGLSFTCDKQLFWPGCCC